MLIDYWHHFLPMSLLYMIRRLVVGATVYKGFLSLVADRLVADF